MSAPGGRRPPQGPGGGRPQQGGPGWGPPPGYGGQGGQGYGGQGYAAPGYGPPSGHRPPAPPPRRRSGAKVALVVVGVVVALLVAGGVAVFWFVSSTVGRFVGESGAGCGFAASADVDAALGGSYELVQLGGGIGDLAGVALDSRVLAGEPTCWGVETGDGGRLVRIARYEGGDAEARFAAERTAAGGTTQDQGGGLSVSTDSYLARDVDAGDEAFCTTGDGTTSAGALVRRGDLLVYVSTTAAGGGASVPPQLAPTEDGGLGFSTDAANCDLAVALAGRVS